VFRAARYLTRLVRIGLVLARHDAIRVLDAWQPPAALDWLLDRLKRTDLSPRPGERLTAALAELGPSFVKIGQALSTRADLVGEELAADLSRLQDKLPPFPAEQARATVERELNQALTQVFASFESEPVAAASIAQVHFATTPDGAPVAVKVLRPGIERVFARDIAMFRWLAGQAERWSRPARRLRPVAVVEQFAETVRLEMDLRLEAAAAAELAANFADDPEFRVPAVDWTRTARRVLTMQRIAGTPVDERERLIALGHDPQEIVAKAARAFFRMVFRDGFFHADMHPGNVFVAEDGALIAVDFGIMGRIDMATRTTLADMLIGFLTRDYQRVADVHIRAGFVPADRSAGAFAQAARAIAEPILGRPLAEISLARLLAQLFEVTEQFEMRTQPQLLLLQKSMLVCEGVGRRLAPDLNMWQLAEPMIVDWIAEHRGPAARVRNAIDTVLARLDDLPGLVERVERVANAPPAPQPAADRPLPWPWLVAAALFGALAARFL
jgi:ubiquinone biosynthesis protein